MSDLLVRNIPDVLKERIEATARNKGVSLSARSIELMHKGLSAEASNVVPASSAWDVWRKAFEDAGLVDDSFADTLDEVVRQRKDEPWRALPDEE